MKHYCTTLTTGVSLLLFVSRVSAAVIRNPAYNVPVFQTTGSIVVDTFDDHSTNSLGFFHGAAGAGTFADFEVVKGDGALRVNTNDIDASFVTDLANGCTDITPFQSHYLHIEYNGSPKFSISLQQHNANCDDARLPMPQTWDSVQAERYSTADNHDIYIPMKHFNIDFGRVIGIALENWYTNATTWIYKIEILPPSAVPMQLQAISKLPSGRINTGCTNPNYIAFGIDDGSPEYLKRTMQIIKEEQIPVTFFVQGLALQYGIEDGNFSAAYREMHDLGHQIGLHTMTHPHVESLQTTEEINAEITRNIEIVKEKLDVETRYFRPPYGTVGARTREALARYMDEPEIMMWSIDVADWIYGADPDGDPKRMQYETFADSLSKGGSIVVMHYLYESTVDQFRDMVRLAKSKGRQFVRADQCVGDPNAPEIWGWTRN